MLRCVACLYRLEGIIRSDETSTQCSIRRPPEVIRIAREGLLIFATLAQQLGLHALKNRIEDRAFRILYQRQYRAVAALYEQTNSSADDRGTTRSFRQRRSDESNVVMEAISASLQSHIHTILFEDEDLMEQLVDLKVTSRVKERFSFWKKLVKKRFHKISRSSAVSEEAGTLEVAAVACDKSESLTAGLDTESVEEANGSSSSLFSLATSPSLSSQDLDFSDCVPDAVALRVILRARKWYRNEPAERVRERERSLCYYVQQKLRSRWPATDPARVKDYIQFPKANGEFDPVW